MHTFSQIKAEVGYLDLFVEDDVLGDCGEGGRGPGHLVPPRLHLRHVLQEHRGPRPAWTVQYSTVQYSTGYRGVRSRTWSQDQQSEN